MEPIDQHLHGHAPGADLSDLGTGTENNEGKHGENADALIQRSAKISQFLISWKNSWKSGKVYADFMENNGKKRGNLKQKKIREL